MVDFCFVLKRKDPDEHNHPETKMRNHDPLKYHSEHNVDTDDGYSMYVETHGKHFTEQLAAWASEHMKHIPYADTSHIWTLEDVRSSYERLGIIKPVSNTWGDAVYASNMHYSDYYGLTLRTESECIKQGQADLSDPDGYPEKLFIHWCSDMKEKGINIPWREFI